MSAERTEFWLLGEEAVVHSVQQGSILFVTSNSWLLGVQIMWAMIILSGGE